MRGFRLPKLDSISNKLSTTYEGCRFIEIKSVIILKTRDEELIYAKPMLLISNIKVTSYLQAKEVYHIYLMRSKIEATFKFLKDVLGWEEFQVRDWDSIKNIIALCFFIGNYFYEIESALIDNPTIEIICQIGGGKGTVSRHFFLEGLKGNFSLFTKNLNFTII